MMQEMFKCVMCGTECVNMDALSSHVCGQPVIAETEDATVPEGLAIPIMLEEQEEKCDLNPDDFVMFCPCHFDEGREPDDTTISYWDAVVNESRTRSMEAYEELRRRGVSDETARRILPIGLLRVFVEEGVNVG